MKSRIIRKKGRIIIPKPSKMKPEPTQNDSKIDAETGLQKMSEKVTSGIPSGFLPVYSFWSKIRPKSSKLRFFQDFWHPKRHPKIDAEKVWKKYARRFPKWDQNGCPNHYFFILFQKRRKLSKLFVLQYKTWCLLTKKQ